MFYNHENTPSRKALPPSCQVKLAHCSSEPRLTTRLVGWTDPFPGAPFVDLRSAVNERAVELGIRPLIVAHLLSTTTASRTALDLPLWSRNGRAVQLCRPPSQGGISILICREVVYRAGVRSPVC